MFFVSSDKLKINPIPKIHAQYMENALSTQRLNTETIHRLRELQYRYMVLEGTIKIDLSVLDSINHDIRKLNGLIAAYNAIEDIESHPLHNRDRRINALRHIEEEFTALDAKYEDTVIVWLVSYQVALLDNLVAAIQQQKAYLHINYHYVRLPWKQAPQATNLLEALHSLQSCHHTGLLEFLEQGEQAKLEDLTIVDIPETFKEILRGSLEFLGGGNTLCFSLPDPQSQEKRVLKAENILSNSKCFEQQLRKILQDKPDMQDFITPNFFERRARYFHHKFGHTMGRLILTTYCNKGTLYEYLLKQDLKFADYPRFVLELMLKLAKKIQGLSQSRAVNTDLKPMNVLLQEDLVSGEISLHVSDCKAFYLCDDNGVVMSNGHLPIGTRYYMGPEFIRRRNDDSIVLYGEALAIYTLGKSLYEALLGYKADFVKKSRDKAKKCQELDASDFEYSVFKWSKEGPDLKDLILDMLHKDVTKRVEIEEVIARMTQILCLSEAPLRQHCLEQLEILETYQFGCNNWIKEYSIETRQILAQKGNKLRVFQTKTTLQTHLVSLLADREITAFARGPTMI